MTLPIGPLRPAYDAGPRTLLMTYPADAFSRPRVSSGNGCYRMCKARGRPASRRIASPSRCLLRATSPGDGGDGGAHGTARPPRACRRLRGCRQSRDRVVSPRSRACHPCQTREQQQLEQIIRNLLDRQLTSWTTGEPDALRPPRHPGWSIKLSDGCQAIVTRSAVQVGRGVCATRVASVSACQ